MVFKLDAKNLKLLNELEKNSRKPISQIAKAIGTSKEVANYRLKNMISSGFIKKFVSVVDYFSLNYRFYRLVIDLHNLKYYIRSKIIEDLNKIDYIDLNVYLLSNKDLEINLWVKNSKEFYDFYEDFVEKYSEYISGKEFNILTKIRLYSHGYLHKSHRETVIGDEKSKKKNVIDEIDEKILKELGEDPRQETIKLAQKLHISPSTLQYRIKQLISKKIMVACRPILNKSILGYNSYRVELILNSPVKKKEVINYLASKDNVTKISEIIGRKDLDFEIDFKTNAELDNFLEELRIKMPYIKDFEIINVLSD